MVGALRGARVHSCRSGDWVSNRRYVPGMPSCVHPPTIRCPPPTLAPLTVDLLGVDLDAAVSIERGRIQLYPCPAGADQSAADGSPAPAAPGGAKAPSGRPSAARAAPAARGPLARRTAPAAAKPAPAPATAAAPAPSARTAGSVSTAPRPGLPPPGKGLNKAALVTFRRMGAKAGADPAAVDGLRAKLAEASARMGGVFVHYDPTDGVWLVKLDAWQ